MKKETFIKKIETKVAKFNAELQAAIDEMGGENMFYYTAGEAAIGEQNPIDPAEIKGQEEITETTDAGEPYKYLKVTITTDGIDDECTIDEDGDADFDELDETFKYLRRRIRRTLKFWNMDGDKVDRELDRDTDDDE